MNPIKYSVKDEKGRILGVTLFDPIRALESYKKAVIRVERERDMAIERCKKLQREAQCLKADKFDLQRALEAKHLVIADPQMPYLGILQKIKSRFKRYLHSNPQ